ncbi:MAG: VOC family protein [Actinomycetota bacterium]|nr:VOC family protein [Actinomycetota bacterium]
MAPVKDRASLATSTLIDGIARVDLRVTDIDKALSFYRDVVGLEVARRDTDSALLTSPGESGFLALDSTGVTRPADPQATGLFHTAIRFPTRTSLGDALARLVNADLEIGAGDHLVSEALYIDDPDGNGVELYWDRPVDQWPPPSGDMLVPMATLPVDLQSLLDDGKGRAAIEEAAPAATDIGHVHLQVSHVDKSIEFYTKVLGLDLTARLGGSAGFFSSNGYHHNIGANSWRSRGCKPSESDRAGLQRIVFSVTDPDALETVRSRLLTSGQRASGDAERLVVNDPDGIELEFVIS